MYNENMLTKQHLCESICLLMTARNTLLSRYNNEDLSEFSVTGNLARSKHYPKAAYLKRFVIGKEGIMYLDPIKLAVGERFNVDFYQEKGQITCFYLIESDKEKVGLPTVMDASEHIFYGRRVTYDHQ